MDYQGIMTSTAQSLTGYVVDGLHSGSVVPARFMPDPVEWDEGLYYQQPIQTSENDNGGPFVGMPIFDVSAQNNDQNLKWLAKGERQSIVVPWAEVAHNKTKAGVIKLVGRKMDIAKNSMNNRLASELLALGMGDAIEGLDKMTDNSTQTSEYGTLLRSTYGAVINGQLNPMVTISLSALGTQLDACTPGNSDQGTTTMLTTKTIFGYTESILDPKTREMYSNVPTYVSAYTKNGNAVKASELGGASGFVAIWHRGVPMVKEEKVVSGKTYFLNENAIDFVSLEFPQMKQITLQNEVTKGVYGNSDAIPTSFQVTEMMTPPNQLGEIGHIIAYGNLINRNAVRCGATTGTLGF